MHIYIYIYGKILYIYVCVCVCIMYVAYILHLFLRIQVYENQGDILSKISTFVIYYMSSSM